MLSFDLDALSARFEGYARGGVELSPLACDALAVVLADMAEHARQMEGQPVPLAALAQAQAADNVVLLWDEMRLRRRAGRRVPSPIDQGPVLPGGGAA